MMVTRVAIARVISIVGHPVVFLFVAALIAASSKGASLQRLWFVGGTLGALGVVVLAFSWWQVRSGRWSHMDASVRSERKSLNLFLGVICLLCAALLWFLAHQRELSLGLALSGALIFIALLIAPWVKASLHVAFAAFATALLWPIKLAFVAGALLTAALAWSRLVLGRHVAADVATGLVLGAAAGGAYYVWGL